MGEHEIDTELVQRAQKGDKSAFDLLVRKYQHRIAAVVSRFVRNPAECQDVVQDSFIKACFSKTFEIKPCLFERRRLETIFPAEKPWRCANSLAAANTSSSMSSVVRMASFNFSASSHQRINLS
jgi:hypothetical protein